MFKFQKAIMIILLGFVALAPFFSQSITIDVKELERIIAEKTSKAIDDAVVEAVKAERLRFADIENGYKLQIIDLNAKLDKKDILIQNQRIIIDNLKTENNELRKKLITTNLSIGGVSLVTGFAGGFLTYAIAIR